MLKPFLVIYKDGSISEVKEYEDRAAAEAESDRLLDAGTIAIVYYATSLEDLDIEAGDSDASDKSDEMDFQGFDD